MAWPRRPQQDPLAGYSPDWRNAGQEEDPLAGYSPDWRETWADDVSEPLVPERADLLGRAVDRSFATSVPLAPERADLLESAVASSFVPEPGAEPTPPARVADEPLVDPLRADWFADIEAARAADPVIPEPEAPSRNPMLEEVARVRNSLARALEQGSGEHYSPEFVQRTQRAIAAADEALRGYAPVSEELTGEMSALLNAAIDSSFVPEPGPRATLADMPVSVPAPGFAGVSLPYRKVAAAPVAGAIVRAATGLGAAGVRGAARLAEGLQEPSKGYLDAVREMGVEPIAEPGKIRLPGAGSVSTEPVRDVARAMEGTVAVARDDRVQKTAELYGDKWAQRITTLGDMLSSGLVTSAAIMAAPVIATPSLFMLGLGEIDQEAEAKGLSPEDRSFLKEAAVGYLYAQIERLGELPASPKVRSLMGDYARLLPEGLDEAVRRGAKPGEILTQFGLWEAAEEAAQELAAMGVVAEQADGRQYMPEEVLQRVALSALGGAVGSLPMGALTAVRSSLAVPEPGARSGEPAPRRGPAGATESRSIRRRMADIIDPSRQAELEEAFRDPLTGLPNQTAFRRAREHVDADPEQHWGIVDLVNFKAINDNIGTDAGDARLAEVATILREEATARGVDSRNVIRAGGDEFAIAGTDPVVTEEILSAATDRLEPLQAGDYVSSMRWAIGNTWTEADANVQAKKAEETGARARDVKKKAVATGGGLTLTTWEGRAGDTQHMTGKEEGVVPVSAIAGYAGVKGEVRGEHLRRQGEAWEAFKADIEANGIKDPIFITVDPGKDPQIAEGNHRLDAAIELGLTEVPVEVRYFGQAEQAGTILQRASAPDEPQRPTGPRAELARLEAEIAKHRRLDEPPGLSNEESLKWWRALIDDGEALEQRRQVLQRQVDELDLDERLGKRGPEKQPGSLHRTDLTRRYRAEYEGLSDDDLVARYKSLVRGLARTEPVADETLQRDQRTSLNTYGDVVPGTKSTDYGMKARGRQSMQAARVDAIAALLYDRGLEIPEVDPFLDVGMADVSDYNKDLVGRGGKTLQGMSDADLEAEIRRSLELFESAQANPDYNERMALLWAEANREGRNVNLTAFGGGEVRERIAEYAAGMGAVPRSTLTVRSDVPNTSSIAASLTDYEVLPDIQHIAISAFDAAPRDLFVAADDLQKVRDLTERIRESGEISPLIVVQDAEGYYVLEGAHRLGALHELGEKAVPAMVVRDLESLGTTQERISAALVRVGDEVATGDSHFHAIQQLQERGINIDALPDDTPVFVGFQTDAGREVTREEAAVIQGVPDAKLHGRRLSSEEVPELREAGYARAEREDPSYAAWAVRMRQMGAIKETRPENIEDLRRILREGPPRGDVDLFGEPVRREEVQGELLPESLGPEGMTAALDNARAVVSALEGRALRGDLGETDLKRYEEARSLLRRAEGRGLDEGEIRARIETPEERDDMTEDLFGEPTPKKVREQLKMTFGSTETAQSVKADVVKHASSIMKTSMSGVMDAAERARKVRGGREAVFAWVDSNGVKVTIGEKVPTEPGGRLDKAALTGLMRVFRHPSAEYMHVVRLGPEKEGGRKVVGHHISSSGAIDMSLFPMVDIVEALAAAKREDGGVVVVHNHPSGDPTPSAEDRSVTKAAVEAAKKVGGRIEGHLVINGGEAVFLDADGQEHRIILERPADDWNLPDTKKVRSPADIFSYVSGLPRDADRVDLMMLNTQGEIVAYSPHHIDELATMAEWLPGLLRDTAARAYIVGVQSEAALRRTAQFAIDSQVIPLDIVAVTQHAFISAHEYFKMTGGSFPAQSAMLVHQEAVREEGEEYRLSPEEYELPGEGSRRHDDMGDPAAWYEAAPQLPGLRKGSIPKRIGPLKRGMRRLGGWVTAYYETLIDKVKGQGGHVGIEIAERAEKANSRIKQLMGKWDDARATAQKLVSVGKKAQQTVNWLQATRNGRHPAAVYRRIVDAMEGRIPEEKMPPRVRKEIEALRRVNEVTGEEFERIGLLQVVTEVQEDPQLRAAFEAALDGDTEAQQRVFRLFTKAEGGRIFLRLATPILRDIWTQPTTELSRNPLWEAYVEMLAAENDVEPQEARRLLEAARAKAFKRVHAEIPRIFQNHPTDMRVTREDGTTEILPLLWTHPFGYADALVRSSAHRVAFVEEFGQGLTETKLADLQDRALQARINPADTERLLRAISGLGQTATVTAPDAFERDLTNIVTWFMRMPLTTMLTRAWVPNTFEAFGNIQAFGGGPIRFIRAMAKLSEYGSLQKEFARMGLVQTWVMNATIDKQRPLHHSVPRIYREWVLRLFPTIHAWKIQEMQAAAMGVTLAEDLRTGKSKGIQRESDRMVLEKVLDFDREMADRLVSGKGTAEEYVEVARRFTTRSNTTLLSLPAEESRAASSDHFNAWIKFHRYSMMKVRTFEKVHRGLIDNARAFQQERSKKNLNRLIGSMQTISRYHAGTAASGTLTYMFLALLAGGPAGLAVALKDFEDDPLEFVAKGWVSAQFGPIATSLARIWTDRRIDNFWMLSAPASVGVEAVMAAGGFGKYQFMSPQERFVGFLRRIAPGPRAIVDVAVAAGLTEDDPQRELAIDRYWQWMRENAPPEQRTEWMRAEADTKRFRRNMRDAYNAMRKKQSAETIADADEAINRALEVENKDATSVARSIRAHKMLPRVPDELVDDFEGFMGPDLLQALEAHDELLEAWAARFTVPSGARRRPTRRRLPTRRR